MTVDSRTYDQADGTPVVVLVVSGPTDVARLVGLLAQDDYHHSPASRKLRQQVKRHNGGQAALRLLAQHGGPDFTEGRLTTDEIAVLSIPERQQLPAQHHEPMWLRVPGAWVCRVCWNQPFPCPPAGVLGGAVARHLGLDVG